MAEEQPYNSLGQILAMGGEIALGLAIAYGWSDSQIAVLFARRFEPMTDDDRDRLTGLARAAVDAANGINDLDREDSIDIDTVPVNPLLFGEGLGSGRALSSVDISFDSGDTWRTIRLEMADINTVDDLISQAAEIARQRARKSPGNFPGSEDDSGDPMQFRVTFIERKF